jgi:hypothetical protein
MPGATTARLVVCDFEMPMKLFMMPPGPAGSVAIGTEVSMTRGFAEEWLAWRDHQKTADDLRKARCTIGVTIIIAVVGWAIALLK